MSFAPSGFQVDIEFTAGVWTNVTSKVRTSPGVSIRFGRTSPTGTPQVASCSLTLDNASGDFTAKNAGSAYYPNVVPGKRVRVSINSGTSPRFVGYIKSWQPAIDGATAPVVVITAVDRAEALSRRALRSLAREAAIALTPTAYFPLGDAVSPLENLGATTTPLTITSPPIGLLPASLTYATGAAHPFSDGDKALGFDTTAVSGGFAAVWKCPFASTALPTSQAAITVAAWLTLPVVAMPPGSLIAGVWLDGVPGHGTGFNFTSGAGYLVVGTSAGTASVTGSSPADDGLPHHFAITYDGTTTILYIDGASAGSVAGGPAAYTAPQTGYFYVSADIASPAFQAIFADVLVHSTALTAGQIFGLYSAGATGNAGELSGARAARVLGYGGVVAGDRTVSAGRETMGGGVTSGKSVTTAIDDIATTEGGGSAYFIDVDGKARFIDRAYRTTATGALTIDAGLDVNPTAWAPFFDDLARVNQSTVSRNGGNDQTYTDAASVASLGVLSDSATSYASTDSAALTLAQWRVRSTTSSMRFPQLAVNLARVTNSATLYAALPSVTIGSRLAITNIPATRNNAAGVPTRIFHTTQLDTYVEGWSEQIGAFDHTITFDLSPAESRHILEDTTWGRLVETAGSMTLNGAITSSATSISVATSGGNPTFTLVAGSYPLYIKVDEEIISISSAPAGAATPQTLTVTRGALGTFADAHANGATVSVYTGALVL